MANSPWLRAKCHDRNIVGFLIETLGNAATHSRAGAVHYVCMDWRHLGELLEAGQQTYGEMLNLAVWVKSNAGQGSFYRSQHELIGVFRVGEAPHLNNIELGRHGRSRSNVWHYAGVNSFRAGRMDELSVHPTVKPVALVADAMKDCTRRQDIVLDTFCGSGTTLLAAERVGRRAYWTGARAPIRRCRHPPLASLHPARCGPRRDPVSPSTSVRSNSRHA